MFDRAPVTAIAVDVNEVPAGSAWLGSRERSAQSGLRFGKRAADWRAGRWVAKSAVARRMHIDPARIEILNAPSGAPQAWIEDRRLPVNVSISHRAGRAVAIASAEETPAGCDVETVEPRPSGFVDDWFTAAERAAVDSAAPGDRDELVTLIWSAKESVLKALGVGLRMDTRWVDVTPAPDGFGAELDGVRIDGWWERDGRYLLTAAALEGAR